LSEGVVPKNKNSIVKQLLFAIIMLSTIAALLVSALQLYLDYKNGIERIRRDLDYVKLVSLTPLTSSIWNWDEDAIEAQMRALINHPTIDYAEINALNNTSTEFGTKIPGRSITTIYPLAYNDGEEKHELGILSVEASLSRLFQQLLEKTLVVLGTNLLMILVLVSIIYMLFHVLFTRQLNALVEYVRGLDFENAKKPFTFQRKSRSSTYDEFDEIAGALNDMQLNLKSTYDALVEHKDHLEEKVTERTLHLEKEIEEREAAEALLRESEARLLQILDNSAFGVSITSLATKTRLFINPGFIKMFGGDATDYLAHREREDSYVDPSSLKEHWAALDETGHITAFEEQRIRKDGSEWWSLTDWRILKFGGEDAVMSWYDDISDRKRSEQELHQNSELADLLRKTASNANSATYFDEALRTCMSTIIDFMGWPVGHVFMRSDEDNSILVSSDIWHLDDPEYYKTFRQVTERARIARGKSFASRVLKTGKPIWIEDVSTHPSFSRSKDADQDIRVRSGFAMPVASQGQVVAVVEFFSNEIVEQFDEFMQILDHIGDQLGRVFEREQGETELRNAMDKIDMANRGLEQKVRARTQELENARDEAEQAAELVQLGRWVWNVDENRCISCSDEYARIRGVSVNEILAKDDGDQEWAHPDDFEWYENQLRQGRQQGKVIDIEYRLIDSNGRLRHVREIARPIFNSDSGPTLVKGVVQDITTQKNTQEALRIAKQDAEAASREAVTANKTKTEFLANMSHELRTPLNAIIGFSDIVKGAMFGPLQSKYQDYAKDINDSGKHLLRIISDILDISKVEAGKLDIDQEHVDLIEIISACEMMLGDRISEAGLSLTYNIATTIPDLYADPMRLKQILMNLLTNAIKFTPEGGDISVSAISRDDGSVSLVVADSGIGIAEEDIAMVLEKFGQVREGHTHAHEGAGLGLALVKSLMERHQGTLEIKSKVGDGTTVTVTFPPDRPMSKNGRGVG